MHILVLGGSNNINGNIDQDTKNRCNKSIQIISKNNEKNIIIHFSGGINQI